MKRVALVVGVDQYEDGTFGELRHAAGDAVALAAAFGRRGFETHVAKNPGASELLGAVERGTAGLGSGDVFVFSFSGLGCTGTAGEPVLLCRDDRRIGLRHGRAGVPLGMLEDLTNGPGFHRAFFLDVRALDGAAGKSGTGGGAGGPEAVSVELPDAEKNPGTCCVFLPWGGIRSGRESGDAALGEFAQAAVDFLTGSEGRGARTGEAFAAGVAARMRGGRRDGGEAGEVPVFRSNGTPFELFGTETEGGEERRGEGERDADGIAGRNAAMAAALEAAGREPDLTKPERVALEKVAEVQAAGEAAWREGRGRMAENLFALAKRALGTWKNAVDARRARERGEAERKRSVGSGVAEKGQGVEAGEGPPREMEPLPKATQALEAVQTPARTVGAAATGLGPDEGEMVHQKGWWTRHWEAVAWYVILLSRTVGAAATGLGPDEGEMVHQKGWWTRHWEAVAWYVILLLVIGFLGFLWGWERKQRLEEWESVRKAASGAAAAGNYRAAVKKLDEIPAGWRNWVFLTRRSKFASDFRAGWEAMGEVEEKLKAARSREVDARKELSKLNPWKEKCQALPREKAPQEWSDYKDAYEKTEKLKEDNLRFNQEYGLPNRNGKIVFPTKEEAAEIPDSYDDVAKGWRDAANCLRAAGQKVEAEEEKQKLREKQERAQQELEHKKDVWQKASGPVEVARAQADAASAKLADVEERNSAFGIAKEYGGYEWRQYEFHRNRAREANWTIEVRGGLPYREKDGQWVELSVDDIQALTNHYKTAETEWCAAEASFTNACARILEHRDLKKLNEERTKAAEAFQSIQELLGKKALYEAAGNSAKAQGHLKLYGAAFRRAQEQIQGVQFDEGSGLPLRGPGRENEPLGRTELSELCRKFATAETDLREAQKELNAAYQAVKEERPVKAKPGDAQPKKAPDAGESESRGEKGVDRGGATGPASAEGGEESGGGTAVAAASVPDKSQEEEEGGEHWYVLHPTEWKTWHPTRWFGDGEEKVNPEK